jgi:hypothetical protein
VRAQERICFPARDRDAGGRPWAAGANAPATPID